MDKKDQTPEPPELPEKTHEDPLKDYEAMENSPDLAATIDNLLKSPGRVLYEWQEGRGGLVGRHLGLIAAVAFLLFGLILGLFSGGTQLWAAPVKVFGGILVSALITLPSLYVFSCLGGIDMTLRKAGGLLLLGLALVGMVLLGLCPVAWIFSQSTQSVGFMGFLVLLFWLVSLCFGVLLIFRSARKFGTDRGGYLVLWALIFVTVTMQMSTSLRPIIGPAEETFLPQEKRFFLGHWFEVMGEE
ncbi:MAG: hypothetical protein MI807_18670 [Verrucomicrobiales bacterium]|nr:hypothetical protein [Verrucomicrobiales bacterium]